MPRWGKSVSRRRKPRATSLCVCGCREPIGTVDLAAGRSYIKVGHRRETDNPVFKGADITDFGTARMRARKAFPLEPCEVCSSERADRHHIDGNVNNNERSNIAFLCRRHHMERDGRIGGGKRLRAYVAATPSSPSSGA